MRAYGSIASLSVTFLEFRVSSFELGDTAALLPSPPSHPSANRRPDVTPVAPIAKVRQSQVHCHRGQLL